VVDAREEQGLAQLGGVHRRPLGRGERELLEHGVPEHRLRDVQAGRAITTNYNSNVVQRCSTSTTCMKVELS
jgi:hypothetical protein